MGEAAILQARAGQAQSEALLRRAQRNLSYCTITSPVKGVIIDRRVNIGQTVVASLNAPSLFLIAKDLTAHAGVGGGQRGGHRQDPTRPAGDLHRGRLPRRDRSGARSARSG